MNSGTTGAGNSQAAEPLLELTGISKRFGTTQALRGASLLLAHGEVLGLIGDNGAGKSTLVKIVAGVHTPDTGSFKVRGVPQSFANPAEARDAGIETVFQTLSLIPTLDITDNVFLNREACGPGRVLRTIRRMNRREMVRTVQESYERLGLDLPPPGTKVAALSGGQRQAVSIARAVIWQRDVLILDEPTAALGVKQTEIVLSFISRLRSHGVSVVFISHNMENVMRVCDRIVVIRLGATAFQAPRAETSGRELIEYMTGANRIAGDEGPR